MGNKPLRVQPPLDSIHPPPLKVSLNSLYQSQWVGIISTLSLLLNAGLMIYAHVGLSGVFVSNQQRIDQATSLTTTTASTSTSGRCTTADIQQWQNGGAWLKSNQSTYCALGYHQRGCLFSPECTTECFVALNYSETCAACFAPLPACNFQAGCQSVCSGEARLTNLKACLECTVECDAVFYNCTGFPYINVLLDEDSEGDGEGGNATQTPNQNQRMLFQQELSLQEQEACAAQHQGVDYNDVEDYYVVYNLTFVQGLRAAWNGNARLLAVIVVIFSGIWPYAKNVLLVLVWYLPLTASQRAYTLQTLRRLGKYTLVDVYVVMALMVAVQLQIAIAVADGKVPVIIKGEPRFAIVAFYVATIWEFIQFEWMTHVHQQHYQHQLPNDNNHHPAARANILQALRFQTAPLCPKSKPTRRVTCQSPALLVTTVVVYLVVCIALYIAGTLTQLIQFTSILPSDEDEGCPLGYNLYSFGTALVSPQSLHLNSPTTNGMVWFLFLFAYILLLIVTPLVVHAIHIIITTNLLPTYQKTICLVADIAWTFASIDVFLVAVFVIQYKFSDMMEQIAGNDGSQFFAIDAHLGPGFFILIVYSVCAGIFQWLLNCAVYQYYRWDAMDKTIWVPSVLLPCCCFVGSEEATGVAGNNDDNKHDNDDNDDDDSPTVTVNHSVSGSKDHAHGNNGKKNDPTSEEDDSNNQDVFTKSDC